MLCQQKQSQEPDLGGKFQSFAIWQVIRKKMIFLETFLQISFSYTKRVQKKIGRYYTMKFPKNPSVCISLLLLLLKFNFC